MLIGPRRHLRSRCGPPFGYSNHPQMPRHSSLAPFTISLQRLLTLFTALITEAQILFSLGERQQDLCWYRGSPSLGELMPVTSPCRTERRGLRRYRPCFFPSQSGFLYKMLFSDGFLYAQQMMSRHPKARIPSLFVTNSVELANSL